MIRFFLLTSLFIGVVGYSQVKWNSISEVIKLQEKAPRKAVVLFFDATCKSCKELDDNAFEHPALSEYIQKYYYVIKFNIHSSEEFTLLGRKFQKSEYSAKKHEFVDFMNVSSVPSIVFLDEHLQPITLIQGRLSPQELEPYLIFMNSKNYSKVNNKKSWELFLSGFKPKMTR